MTFSIRYRQGPGGADSRHWTASLTEAKLHASEVVRSGSAPHAEVRDADGKLVYRYPEEGAGGEGPRPETGTGRPAE